MNEQDAPHKIWIDQCEAARGIEAEFGMPWQLAEYLEQVRQTERFDPSIYDDDDDVELERQFELRRSAADLLLVERAKEWLLGV